MNCFCGHYPVLKQSWSDKNPGRLYLSCGDNRKCKFFRWADEPVLKENFKDPLAVHDWLNTAIPDLGESNHGKEIRPPIYGESLVQAEQRLQQTHTGPWAIKQEIVESDPPVLCQDYVPLHKDMIERGKLVVLLQCLDCPQQATPWILSCEKGGQDQKDCHNFTSKVKGTTAKACSLHLHLLFASLQQFPTD